MEGKEKMILVTGAKGVVGTPLREALDDQKFGYIPVSRAKGDQKTIEWDMSSQPPRELQKELDIDTVIHCAPIWLLAPHMQLLSKAGVKRFIVFSSTSVIAKANSRSPKESELVQALATSESAIFNFCQQRSLDLWILRPSMIYGYARDENVSHLCRFIHKYGFAVVAGKGQGLRQPVHADDLVSICLQILARSSAPQQGIFNVAGAEELSYYEMLERIFNGMGRVPRIIRLPVWVLSLALRIAAVIGRFDYTSDMADRMNKDLNYSNDDILAHIDYRPQSFLQQPRIDLPHLARENG